MGQLQKTMKHIALAEILSLVPLLKFFRSPLWLYYIINT